MVSFAFGKGHSGCSMEKGERGTRWMALYQGQGDRRHLSKGVFIQMKRPGEAGTILRNLQALVMGCMWTVKTSMGITVFRMTHTSGLLR